MSQSGMIASVIGVVGALIVVTSGSGFRAMEHGKRIKLALIWLLIIIVLAWLAQTTGLHTPA
ncbi:MAG: hypothetical protein KGJ57_16005 [Sphingomonadales bacterium]|nr:hypothetical protein [Sphingomonadales bacterium]MDE2170907.1 hypothetical protein [Sphingomonadales bacterium]